MSVIVVNRKHRYRLHAVSNIRYKQYDSDFGFDLIPDGAEVDITIPLLAANYLQWHARRLRFVTLEIITAGGVFKFDAMPRQSDHPNIVTLKCTGPITYEKRSRRLKSPS